MTQHPTPIEAQAPPGRSARARVRIPRIVVGPGIGIHWPAIDEDVSVEALLAGQGSNESVAPLAGVTNTRAASTVLATLALSWQPLANGGPPFRGRLYAATSRGEPANLDVAGDTALVDSAVRPRFDRFVRCLTGFRSRLPEPTEVFQNAARPHQRSLERALVCTSQAPSIASLAADYAQRATILYEWEGDYTSPLAEAAFAERFIEANPRSPLAPCLDEVRGISRSRTVCRSAGGADCGRPRRAGLHRSRCGQAPQGGGRRRETSRDMASRLRRRGRCLRIRRPGSSTILTTRSMSAVRSSSGTRGGHACWSSVSRNDPPGCASSLRGGRRGLRRHVMKRTPLAHRRR